MLLGPSTLLVGVLARRMLFTDEGLNGDWTNHLWYLWVQSQAIRLNLHPSYFLNYSHSIFYPEYAFYGGTIYALAGALSLLLGNAPIETYILTYLMGFAASYGGWYWMARMAGLGRWWAQVPGVIFITSAYYLTLIYARGDWPEFLAVSTIPLLAASALSVLRADRLRLGPALALAGSCVVFFGSHDLTILWGSSVIALTGVLVVICIPEVRRWLALRNVMRVACVAIPAFLVNAWVLLPTIAYQSHTNIASRYPYWKIFLRYYMFIVSAPHLFDLSRDPAAPPGRVFVVVLPVLAIAWTLVCMLVFLRRRPWGPWKRMLAICAVVTTLMAIAMTHAPLIVALPRPYGMLQLSYRLESYVLLGVSGAILAALVLARGGAPRPQLWVWALVPVVAVSILGAIQQTNASETAGSRSSAIEEHSKPRPTEEGLIDYTDADLPTLLARHGRPPEVNFPAASLQDERASKVVHLRPGQAVYSNIGGGPELVQVTGAKIIGISPEGNDVLQIGPGKTRSVSASRRVTQPSEIISVSPAGGLPVVLGRLLTVVAAIFLTGELAVIVIRGARAEHAG